MPPTDEPADLPTASRRPAEAPAPRRAPRRALGRGPGVPVAAADAPPPAPPAPTDRGPESDPPESAPGGELDPAQEPEPEHGPAPDPEDVPGLAPESQPHSDPGQPRTVATAVQGPPTASGADDGPAGAHGGGEGPAGPPGPADPPGTEQARTGPSGTEPAAPDRDTPGNGRFTVRLKNFEGPFDLLLQLISKHKLDVTEVALSKVTDEFMAHIRAMGPDGDLDQTTEFLVVAATLLDLKAARLLPAAEVEDEADLALLEARDLLFARLLQYRAYKRIAEIFDERLDGEGRRYPRTVGLEPHHAELLPEVVIGIGAEGFAALAVKAMRPRARPQVYVDHIHAPLVSVREQAGIVLARLREHGEVSFRELAHDAPDTLTVVARFLALLELYREKAVTLDQEDALGELTVRWTGVRNAEVTDEFDRVREEEKV
ncbi:segregation/condensation protein A [Streptomyces sp. SP18CS02]|uniref:segregation/condensation protein A n=1 Tax=Streptomyces sp. SP18CS02 TaxID=3002531 RepID=UPI002E79928A|nr:segregation/condensation protein A [Streptomyces sp. SP18CS02]MEE1752406.1 segregation/condensation protein A [Streptomyces sp. SP18CS02]